MQAKDRVERLKRFNFIILQSILRSVQFQHVAKNIFFCLPRSPLLSAKYIENLNYILNNTKYFILRRKRREWLPKSPEPEAHV